METTINKVELLGRVGLEPRMTVMDDGRCVMRFSLATNESYKTKSGELKAETTWHRVVIWGNKDNNDFSLIKKGSKVHLFGRIRLSSYEGQDGTQKFSCEIVAQKFTTSEDTD